MGSLKCFVMVSLQIIYANDNLLELFFKCYAVHFPTEYGTSLAIRDMLGACGQLETIWETNPSQTPFRNAMII